MPVLGIFAYTEVGLSADELSAKSKSLRNLLNNPKLWLGFMSLPKVRSTSVLCNRLWDQSKIECIIASSYMIDALFLGGHRLHSPPAVLYAQCSLAVTSVFSRYFPVHSFSNVNRCSHTNSLCLVLNCETIIGRITLNVGGRAFYERGCRAILRKLAK